MAKIPNNKDFPFAEGSQLLFDFAQELIKTNKLDKVSAKKLETHLQRYRGITKKKLDTFVETLTPYVRTRLRKAYYHYVQTGYRQNNPSIQAYRLTDLKPKFRKELDNSIQNSLALIKTQNTETMYNLDRIFRNWVMVPSKELRASLTDPKIMLSHLKTEILNDKKLKRKAEKHFDFIMKDQMNKMVSAMDKITANELGGIGFIWHNSKDKRVVGDPGGLYPVANNPKMHGNHYEREGKLYLFRDTWATKAGYIRPQGDVIYVDKLPDGEPGIPIGCRCFRETLYSLEDIPRKYQDILTKKGKEFLAREF